MRKRSTKAITWLAGLGWNPRRGGKFALLVVLGFTQWLAWGSTYYLMTVIARPIAADTGWGLGTVVAGLSVGLVIAGLVSPIVGGIIERHGGRLVLAAGSALLAVGLAGLSLATHPIMYFSAWAVLGIGMGASLYDAAFAALGWLYGLQARGMIASLTLVGGLVMTVTWPLSALLTATVGWRGACLAYAALQGAVGLPLLLMLLPREQLAPTPAASAAAEASRSAPQTEATWWRRLLLWLLAANLTLQIGMGSVLAVNLLGLLQGLHVTLAAAVALGSVMGACQVGARLIEISLARRVHPVWEGVTASALVFLGFVLLLIDSPPVITVAIITYGLGNGVRTIVKGTLPLVLFGAEGYARLIGLLGMPTLIAQAAGPALGAVVLARYGTMPTIEMLAALALVNLALSYSLSLGLSSPPATSAKVPSFIHR